MAYTWLGDPGTIMEPLTRDERPWAEAWAERRARGCAAPIPKQAVHRHSEACLFGPIETTDSAGKPIPYRQQRCSVMAEGHRPDDDRFMAYLGMADGGR